MAVFFNEIHYENIGIDQHEGVELAGPAGTIIDGWKLAIYNGAGKFAGERTLYGLIPSIQNGFGVVFINIALPNQAGGHALALLNKAGEVSDFISWGGDIKPVDGPASRKVPFRIPFDETARTSHKHSLQLYGTGNKSSDFKWREGVSQSYGSFNKDQIFVVTPKPAVQPPKPEVVDPAPSVPAPAKPSPQVIQSVDLFVAKNRTAHHTDKFHTQEYFAVRRGQLFDIGLGAPNDVTQALIKFSVYPETKTTFTVQVGHANEGNPETEWFGFFSGKEGGKTVVSVSIPGRAIVGKYTLSVSGDGGKTWTPEEPVYVLFNAWSKYDDVFLDNEAARNEYVLEEDGYIWVGSYFNFGPRSWSFSQFNTKSIEAAFVLLKKIPVAQRGDIVTVSRALSALVNVQDDQGVLVGNWSSNYAGGTSPSAWTGSADILKQGAPVKFGQCWVYSGLLTTVARALGIPTRSVTNFASAHDTPEPVYNRSADTYFLADGVTKDESKHSDSVWNFHVWNDAWFARRDLGDSRYTGWQAIDGTPQERSGGKYQMGPVPIIAVKQGEKDIKYDLEFVYSEVNADEKFYVADGKGGYKLVRVVTDSIGKNISTKAIGSSARQDITLEYKYKENSPEERASHKSDQTGDVKVDLDVDQTTKLGKTIHAKLTLTATKNSAVKVQLATGIITYTGRPVTTLEQRSVTVNVVPGTPTTIPFDLTPEKYVPNLKGTNGIEFRAYVHVDATGQATIVQEEFDFVADDVKVEVKGNLKVGESPIAIITFNNPLAITLTNLELTVEGTDLTKVKAGETIVQEVKLYAWAAGKKVLAALLDSSEINDLRGHVEVVIAK